MLLIVLIIRTYLDGGANVGKYRNKYELFMSKLYAAILGQKYHSKYHISHIFSLVANLALVAPTTVITGIQIQYLTQSTLATSHFYFEIANYDDLPIDTSISRRPGTTSPVLPVIVVVLNLEYLK